MFLVKYSSGQYDYYESYDLFVTADEEKAKKYVEKFNNKLAKLKDTVLTDGCSNMFYTKWRYMILETNESYYYEIEVR